MPIVNKYPQLGETAFVRHEGMYLAGEVVKIDKTFFGKKYVVKVKLSDQKIPLFITRMWWSVV